MKRLYVSKTDRKMFGICGGIGETYDIDPTLVRLGLVFLCIATGIVPLLITYIIAGMIVPERSSE